MSKQVLISICIPAYKRLDYIKRSLDAIAQQVFRDFEVVVTDDSPDDQIGELCARYTDQFPLTYHRNTPALGTPENWNEAIRRAKGKWIKLMHDDDWFAFPDSLQKLYELTKAHPDTGFVYCGSTIIENNKVYKRENTSLFREKLLKKDPQNLFFRNFIGPPSVIMHLNDKKVWYDNRMKWLVDVDFYIRYLQHNACYNFTREYLVNVGFNEGQVTKQVFHNRNVVIPENLLLLNKLDPAILYRLWNYDFAWRLIRNYKIRDVAELYALQPEKEKGYIPPALLYITKAQKNIPLFLLNIGIASKCFMLLNYLMYRIMHWK